MGCFIICIAKQNHFNSIKQASVGICDQTKCDVANKVYLKCVCPQHLNGGAFDN